MTDLHSVAVVFGEHCAILCCTKCTQGVMLEAVREFRASKSADNKKILLANNVFFKQVQKPLSPLDGVEKRKSESPSAF